jgi:phosphonoacetaldehyde dehydrogenase
MNAVVKPVSPSPAVRHESMRIAGKKVDTQDRIEVFDPYTKALVGTVPRGTALHAREAFETARNFKSKLTRYERQKILMRTAEILASRREALAELITSESGLCMKDSLYEVGRAYDVFTLAGQLAILDDSQVFSCDITPHGKARRIYTMREPLLGVISAITPFNHAAHGTCAGRCDL